jgi:hypothetical protein
MSSGPTPLRLRALPLADLLDETFRTYRSNFFLFVVLGLVVEAPQLLIQFLSGQYHSFGRSIDLMTNLGNPSYFQRLSQDQSAQSPNFGLILLLYLVVLAITPIALGAPVRAALDTCLGRRPTVESVLRATISRYWGLLLIAIIWAVTALTICCGVGIWILVSWTVAVPAMLEERAGAIDALGRSWDLVRYNWLRLFGIVIVVIILATVVQSSLGGVAALSGSLIPGLSGDLRDAVLLLAVSAVSIFIAPLYPIVETLLYFDLRVRKEAIDLDQMAYLAANSPPGAGA